MASKRKGTRKRAEVDYTYPINSKRSRGGSTDSGYLSGSSNSNKENVGGKANSRKQQQQPRRAKVASLGNLSDDESEDEQLCDGEFEELEELVRLHAGEKVLKDELRVSKYEKVLAKKDILFKQLLASYRSLKVEKREAAAEFLEQLQKGGKRADEDASEHWKSLAKAAEADLAKLAESHRELQQQNAELVAKLAEQTQINEIYTLMTATQITPKSGGTVRCKTVNHNPKRLMEYELNTDAEDISYKPKKIDMGGTNYPYYMKEPIEFEPDHAPVFMRNLLGTVYKKDTPTPRR